MSIGRIWNTCKPLIRNSFLNDKTTILCVCVFVAVCFFFGRRFRNLDIRDSFFFHSLLFLFISIFFRLCVSCALKTFFFSSILSLPLLLIAIGSYRHIRSRLLHVVYVFLKHTYQSDRHCYLFHMRYENSIHTENNIFFFYLLFSAGKRERT